MPHLRSAVLVCLVALGFSATACDTTPSATAALGPDHAKDQPASSATAAGATAAGATAAGVTRAGAAPSAATTTRTLGAPIRATQAVALTALAQDPARYAKQTIKTEGRVTAVCQAMGCWMEISDASQTAHIRMTGHSFFIPKDAAGHHAVLEGTVLAKPDDGECEQEAKEATGKQVKLEIDATGVELL